MQSTSLNFNENHHLVAFNAQSLSLNPLSFKLLKALADSNGNTLSVNQLSSTVWSNSTVSPETIKQRVFVLRKAISEANMQGLVIQSVRGEGYRLIVKEVVKDNNDIAISSEKPAHTRISQYKKVTLAIFTLMFFVIAGILIFKPFTHKPYTNDRVALWTNIEPHHLPEPALTIFGLWHEKLLEQMKDNRLNLVFSQRQSQVLVPIQARQNRIALISYFEVLTKNQKTYVNLSIIEPKTATILRSNRIEFTSEFDPEPLLISHLTGIANLLSSEKLNLSKDQKENPTHRIWPYLKQLSDPKYQ